MGSSRARCSRKALELFKTLTTARGAALSGAAVVYGPCSSPIEERARYNGRFRALISGPCGRGLTCRRATGRRRAGVRLNIGLGATAIRLGAAAAGVVVGEPERLFDLFTTTVFARNRLNLRAHAGSFISLASVSHNQGAPTRCTTQYVSISARAGVDCVRGGFSASLQLLRLCFAFSPCAPPIPTPHPCNARRRRFEAPIRSR